jgi:hypothetical protein
VRGLNVATGLLTAASFAASLGLARAFAATGVFAEWNMLFDADPNIYLKNFSSGRTIGDWGGRSFIHPNLTNLVYPPLRLIAEMLQRLPGFPGSPAEIREMVALAVCPLVTALRVPLMVALGRALGLPALWALSLAALDAVSFSTRLSGSVPESYAFSATLITLAFWLAARNLNGERAPGPRGWLITLFFLIAVAMLNLVAGALILGATLLRTLPRRRALLVTAGIAVAAFAANGLLYEASRLKFRTIPHYHPIATEHLLDGFQPGLARPGIDYPRALANAFIPPAPAERPHVTALNRHRFEFTLERNEPGVRPWHAGTLVVLALAALAAACVPRWPERHRPLGAAAAGLLAFGALTHALFGIELILYMPQWTPAVMVLLAGLYHAGETPRRWLSIALPGLVVWAAVSNQIVIERMLQALSRG